MFTCLFIFDILYRIKYAQQRFLLIDADETGPPPLELLIAENDRDLPFILQAAGKRTERHEVKHLLQIVGGYDLPYNLIELFLERRPCAHFLQGEIRLDRLAGQRRQIDDLQRYIKVRQRRQDSPQFLSFLLHDTLLPHLL